MPGPAKRSHDGWGDKPSKKTKKSNLWFNKSNTRQWSYRRVIERGDAGMFVTSNRGKEAKCVSEMIDILYQDLESQKLLAGTPKDETSTSDIDSKQQEEEKEEDDIEAQIRKEVDDLKPNKDKKNTNPFQAVKLDIPCLSFIKIDKTLDPVQIAHRLCTEARENPSKKRSRWIQRITPITLTQKVLGGGIEQLSREVLKPHFHSGGPSKKYAIRTSIRNNTEWTRDTLIPLVAKAVGPGHSVDLKNYDLLILVDIVQNICGMSVVGPDYDELKRYNLSEIYDPTPKPGPKPSPAPAPASVSAASADESNMPAGADTAADATADIDSTPLTPVIPAAVEGGSEAGEKTT
ncbi:THUMP domain-containing protein [Blastomyces dermatitidis ER-3]|uniref:THUMP domain-containing protein n=2 Tax=Ajellomyces dermatitidis TaxID=5039 RepID=F2T9G5_AJEDA|nr:THUMP domain-containing protein [Blastomyces dermatitidis ER-3]EEQ84055.2 THUMP domain-containing protein [Blastomyces dermatitidis ER-3]EGE79878.1 THUMP domain-containing protein [Blastomyces dermatitidis ATCC 18188]